MGNGQRVYIPKCVPQAVTSVWDDAQGAYMWFKKFLSISVCYTVAVVSDDVTFFRLCRRFLEASK